MKMLIRQLPVSCLVLLLVGMIVSYGGIHLAAAVLLTTPTVAVDPPSIADLSIVSGDLVTFSVDVTNAPAINGFNVVLTYDTNVLQGQSVDLTGNVLSTTGKIPITLANCVDFTGTCPSPGGGTIHVAQLILGGLTGAPTSGLLFSVSFTVKGGFSQIHIQTASLSNGSTTNPVNPPITGDGYFTNIDCPRGSGVLCQPPTVVFTWSPSRLVIGVAAVFDASQSQGPSPGVVITRYFWTWGEPGPHSSTLLCLGCPNQENPNALPLNSTVQHAFQTTCNCSVTLSITDTDGITWSGTEVVDVLPPPRPDFTLQFVPGVFVSPTNVYQGKPFTQTLRLNSTGGFIGLVSLTATLIPYYSPIVANATVSLNPSSVLLSGGTNTTLLTISAQGNLDVSTAQVVVSASSGPLSHSLVLPIEVIPPFFHLSCAPVPGTPCVYQFVPIGGSVTFPIFLISQYGFNGTVTLSASSPGPNILVSPDIVHLEANQTVALETTVSAPSDTAPGLYDPYILAGSPGSHNHYLLLYIVVDTQLPSYLRDIQLEAPASTSLHAGTNMTIPVSLSSLNSFSGRVTVGAAFVPFVSGSPPSNSTPSIPFILKHFSLAAGESLSVLGNISTTFSTIPGSYTLAIGVNAYSFNPFELVSHWTLIQVNVLPPPVSPLIAQFHWKHQVSMSIRGLGAGTETYTAGLYNPNNSTTLFARVVVVGEDSARGETFTVSSQVQTILPLHSLNNIQILQAVDPSAVGSSFTFRTIVEWGVYPSALTQTASASSGVPTTGGFSIVA